MSLRSNCEYYLNTLVPSSSCVAPIAKDPDIVMTVDDRCSKLWASETYEIMVDLETLGELSQNWLILPIFGLDLDIDLQSVSNEVLPTIENILRSFGHVRYIGPSLQEFGDNSIKDDLSRPTSATRVINVLQQLKQKSLTGVPMINGFPASTIISHAICFIHHIFNWYDVEHYNYYSADAFELKIEVRHRQELKRLEKSLLTCHGYSHHLRSRSRVAGTQPALSRSEVI